MTCRDFSVKVHEFIDAQLSASAVAHMEAHRMGCDRCNNHYQDLLFVRRNLRQRAILPESSARLIMRRVSEGNRFILLRWVSSIKTRLIDLWRDLEPDSLWAKASGLPISVVLMVLLLGSLAPIRVEHLAYLVVSSPPWTVGETGSPVVLNVQVSQDRNELTGLVDTAWRLPYEDSLALVAEIQPEGHAEIGSVLEFPKSYALLDAVGSTLRQSRFEKVGEMTSPFLIYSFQKIDVYEQRGL